MTKIPVSNMRESEEKIVLKSLQNHYPFLVVDTLTTSAAVKNGENFMSVVSAVDVQGHDSNRRDEKVEMTLIMKTLPDSIEHRLSFPCDAASSNEAAFYGRVLPSMMRRGELPFPTCLHSSDDVIILNHLGRDGFVMVDRRKGLDLQHCELVMRELGRFHAISLAIKHLQPEEFAEMSSSVREVMVTKENNMLHPIADNCVSMAISVATNTDSPVIQALKDVRGHALNVLSPLVTPSGPSAVICHGDLWSNNLLFRYSSDNPHVPTDLRFLDLQACRYASPALDILYFLFCSATPEVLMDDFHQLVSHYLSKLNENLNQLAPLAQTITMDEILTELKHCAVFGLVMSVMMLSVVTAEETLIIPDDIPPENFFSGESKEEMEKHIITSEFKKRVNGNFEAFIRHGLI